MKLSRQEYKLLQYLINHKSIDAKACITHLGFMRPDRRVSDLRKKFGQDAITTTMVRTPHGQLYAEYAINPKIGMKIVKAVRQNSKHYENKP